MDFSDRLPGCCTVFHGLRPLAGRPACDLLSLLESADLVEAGVGLACANALANKAGKGFLDGDVLDCLDVGPEDHVGMVGHFGPLVGPLKQRARSLTIFERVKEPCGDIRPAGEAVEALRRCQVALITATSIINHTIDGLLEAAGDCREVAILGASTPMLPESFSSTNATLLSGVVVENPGEILRVISEGGGMHFFKPYIRKVSLRVANDKATPRG